MDPLCSSELAGRNGLKSIGKASELLSENGATRTPGFVPNVEEESTNIHLSARCDQVLLERCSEIGPGKPEQRDGTYMFDFVLALMSPGTKKLKAPVLRSCWGGFRGRRLVEAVQR